MKRICFLKKPNCLTTVTVYLDFDDEFPQLGFRWITDEGIASEEKWNNGLDEISYSEYKAMVNKAIEENTVVGEQNDTDKLARIVMGLPGGLFKPAVKFLMWCDRHNLLPRSIIDASPFHTSFFITNLKSLGIGTILHHVYNFGTTSLFVSMGKERYLPVVNQKEHITIKKQMELGITTDERICDGLYFARTIKIMKKYLEHPELLEKPCR